MCKKYKFLNCAQEIQDVAETYYVDILCTQKSHIYLFTCRFLAQFLLLFFLHQMSLALFRVIASLGRNMIVANTFGSFAMLVVMILGGFIISRGWNFL